MVSKNISIREDLYIKLAHLKRGDESFSDVIERLLNESAKGSASRLMRYFGAWSDLPNDFDEIIEKARKSMNEYTSEENNDILKKMLSLKKPP